MSTKTLLITGQYTPPSGPPIGFEIHTTGKNATDNKLILLGKASPEFAKVNPTGYGIALPIVASSFEYFKENVLNNNQNVSWKALVVPKSDSIPGTWQSNDNIVESYDGGGSRKPKRNRLSTRRKLNKRRRSRRNVNRKNKKN